MSQSLYIKDGNGILKELEVISGSDSSRLVPVHSVTGSINTVLSADDLSLLTSSISSVSSAVGLFNQQLYEALTGDSSSMSVNVVNVVTTTPLKANSSTIEIYAYDSGISSSPIQVSSSKSLIVNNQTDASLFLALSESVDTSSYSYIIEPYGYYEAAMHDSSLTHSLLLSSSATYGQVSITKTS